MLVTETRKIVQRYTPMVKIIQSKRVVLATGDVAPATIKIEGGKIVQIHRGRYEEQVNEAEVLDVGDLVVMPGVVDCHVHVNEPGRTEWEGFQTATKAAAAGGVTTIVDMPLNSIPSTTSVEALKIKINHVNKLSKHVDVALWGGVVPGNQDELLEMVELGCRGFKCFMIHSGVDEFQWTREEDIHQALLKLKGAGVPLMFHAEIDIPEELQETDGDVQNYDTFLSSRPDSMETKAIEAVARLCTETKVPCHIVHLSSAQALPVIHKVKAEGSPLTVETTHHYLTLDAGSVPCGATQYKCCPPIRSKRNQERLWEAIGNKDIDMVVSDHSPCTPDLKCLEEGNFIKAWGGIASVQFGLSLFWTGARQRNFSLTDVVRLLCTNTAKLCGLGNRKGSIEVGYDADLVIWDPDASFEVKEDKIHHKWKLTPYLDMELFGVVHKTILGGHLVYDSGNFMDKPMGKLILD